MILYFVKMNLRPSSPEGGFSAPSQAVDGGSMRTSGNQALEIYDTCAWTPNRVLSDLMVLALVVSEVPEGNFLDT